VKIDSLKKAFVSGEAFPPASGRPWPPGIQAYQAFAPPIWA
jgi:hypothetical protein